MKAQIQQLILILEPTKHFIKKVQTAPAIHTWYLTTALGLNPLAKERTQGPLCNLLRFLNLCLDNSYLFIIFAALNNIMYGKEHYKQVCMVGRNHL